MQVKVGTNTYHFAGESLTLVLVDSGNENIKIHTFFHITWKSKEVDCHLNIESSIILHSSTFTSVLECFTTTTKMCKKVLKYLKNLKVASSLVLLSTSH